MTTATRFGLVGFLVAAMFLGGCAAEASEEQARTGRTTSALEIGAAPEEQADDHNKWIELLSAAPSEEQAAKHKDWIEIESMVFGPAPETAAEEHNKWIVIHSVTFSPTTMFAVIDGSTADVTMTFEGSDALAIRRVVTEGGALPDAVFTLSGDRSDAGNSVHDVVITKVESSRNADGQPLTTITLVGSVMCRSLGDR